MKRTALQRRTPLTARTGLTAKTAPARTQAPRKPPRDTGPDRATRALICKRDCYRCVRCGKPCGPDIAEYSLQHRKARGVGGDNSPSNLILLHGSATTGCHAEVERRGERDNAEGYWLWSWQDPAAEGVMYVSEDGGATMWLRASGSLSPDGPEVAA